MYATARLTTACALFALGMLLTPAAHARGPFNLRVFTLWVQPDLDYARTGGEEDISVDADGALGFGASVEYQLSDRLGLELGAFRAGPDVNLASYIGELGLSARASDAQAMTPLSLALDVHLLPEERLDFYIAPFIAYIYYGDLEFIVDETVVIDGQTIRLRDSVRVEVGNDLAYGGALGLDIPFSSKPWAISTSLRYLVTALEVTDPDGVSESIDFDTWMVSLGVRYSF